MAHHQAAVLPNPGGSFWANRPGYEPVLLLIAFIVYTDVLVSPPLPQSMIELVSKEGPSGYSLSAGVKTITDAVNRKLNPGAFKKEEKKDAKQIAEEEMHQKHSKLLSDRDTAQLAKVTLATFALTVFLLGTEALALGATDILVAVLLYLFGILPIEEISRLTCRMPLFHLRHFGRGRRRRKNRPGQTHRPHPSQPSEEREELHLCFSLCWPWPQAFSPSTLWSPCSFRFSWVSTRSRAECTAIEKDRALAVFLLLGLCFAANHGGPGPPLPPGEETPSWSAT